MATPPSNIKQWSTTPASNGIAPNVAPQGWEEGMAPSSVNDTARQQMADHRYQWQDAEWFCWGDTVSRASNTVFKIAADVTSRYLADRRIKCFDTTTLYATVVSSAYSAPDTTITLEMDTGAMSSSLSAVALSILSPVNQAIPKGTPKNENFCIGGNFDTNPWQRGTTLASATNGAYLADMFKFIFVGAGVVDYKKTADAPTVAECGIYSVNCLHIDCTTVDASIAAGDYYAIQYTMEGYDWAQLAQRAFTLSFWVKSTKTGTFCVAFQNVGTPPSDRSYIAEYTVNTTNTWERKVITVTASPSAGTWNYTNGVGLKVSFTLAAGSTFQTTANAWNTGDFLATSSQVNGLDSTSNDFKLQFIQIEPGSQVTKYDIEQRDDVHRKCQRYYRKSYDVGVAPATSTEVGSTAYIPTAGYTAGTNFYAERFTPMRILAPTVAIYSTTGASAKIRNITGGADYAATSANIGDSAFTIQVGAATTLVADQIHGWHYTADASF